MIYNTSGNHYKNIAKIFDNLWSYSAEYIKFTTQKIIEHLDLTPTDTLADIGCGTGIYSQEILNQIQLQHPIICVDPSAEMLAKIPANSRLNPIEMDGVKFSKNPGIYNKIFLKEAIHHIEEKFILFQNLYQRLTPGGIFLLLLWPPDIEHPLFTKALELFEKNQPRYQEMINLLQQVGFVVDMDMIEYPLEVPKNQYFEMVENRYMSMLSTFNDTELAAGLKEIEEKYQDKSVLKFNDLMVFITATKPE
ncbi:MAG: class I SAM-dependent methyltransferase [Okeania sp. SIO2G4]|uniref:class I SAM-dependent methyltransferase n=1 Tax=unclassified Okeania TaxID=2634635 RepID=UPI0013B907E1|nr:MULTISPECIES: class I SAM-dependent methyltransferase [unclassified Okeania]NEP43389.1 class I SAM-dependent methyltransferase [Okeania sp. SIO2H7]NEP71493.1 class I SAM-dependent methyltransferase [Okeania sp. SIO2G5]NEP92780.1 class I SAM-dependent methyltransferase [Okeania sp. SIO2F5]NEQ90248.1 class I SAM-dependent methyltransferase [Okeania sp. SIO2G4]